MNMYKFHKDTTNTHSLSSTKIFYILLEGAGQKTAIATWDCLTAEREQLRSEIEDSYLIPISQSEV